MPWSLEGDNPPINISHVKSELSTPEHTEEFCDMPWSLEGDNPPINVLQTFVIEYECDLQA